MLFTDILMPGGTNGYELAKQASDMLTELKVRLTSGYNDEASAFEGLDFAKILLRKPYTQVDLAKHIQKYITA
ncbi:MAG: two-component SAPR family response regulator [Enterobacterales bacterium]|jgi:two-component SAPR family response regulator